MSEIVISITGDEKKALESWARLKKAQDETDASLAKLGIRADQTGMSMQEMGRKGAQVFEQTRTPAERYGAQLEKLNTLLQKGKIDQDTFNRAVGQAKEKFDEAGKAHQTAFGSEALSIVKTLAGALGIGTGLAGAIQMARKEYESFIEVQKKAKEVTLTEELVQRKALINLGVETPKERDAAIEKIKAMSARTGVSMKDLYERVSTAASAKGALSADQAMEAVEASALMMPGDTQGGIMAAGAVLDLMKNQGGTAKANMGQLLAFQRMARVTDLAKTAEALPAVLLAGTSGGMDVKTSGALWAAITNAIGDVSGRTSQTATIKLFGELNRLLPEKDVMKGVENVTAKRQLGEQVVPERRRLEARLQREIHADEEYVRETARIDTAEKGLTRAGRRAKPEDREARRLLELDRSEMEERVKRRVGSQTRLKGGGVIEGGILAQLSALHDMEAGVPQREVVKIKGTGAKNLEERLAYLHANKESQEKFLEEGGGTEIEELLVTQMKYGRERAKAATQQLVRGKGPAWEAFKKFRAETPTLAQAEAQFPKTVELLGGTDVAQTAAFSRAVETVTEKLAVADQAGARMAIVREKMGPLLKQTGLGYWETKLKEIGLEVGGTEKAIPGFIKEIKQRQQELAHPTQYDAIKAGPEDRFPGREVMRIHVPTELETKQAKALGTLVTLTERAVGHQTQSPNPTLAKPNEDK